MQPKPSSWGYIIPSKPIDDATTQLLPLIVASYIRLPSSCHLQVSNHRVVLGMPTTTTITTTTCFAARG